MEEEKPLPDDRAGKKIIRISDIKPPASSTDKPFPAADEPAAETLLPDREKPKIEPEPFLPKEEEVTKEEDVILEKPGEIEPEVELEKEGFERGKEERIFPEDLFVPKVRKRRKKTYIITAGIVCLVIFIIVSYLSISRAEIIIRPKTETMRFQTELNLDKNVAFIDLEANKIPAQLFLVEKEDEREFPATKEKDLREKALGVITVYNQYSSAPQTLVKGTRFVSGKEKLFKTTQTVVIPGAKVEGGEIIPSTIDVEVEAAEPGKGYNIGPSSFTIPGFKGTAKYTGFYGKSTQSMTGGIIGRVKVVTADDIQGAKDILTIELKEKAEEELEKRIPPELRILKDTTLTEVAESSSNVEPDEVINEFKAHVKIVVKMLGFDESDAISLINDNLKEKISEDKTIVSDTIIINYLTVNDINLDRGTVRLTCDIEEDVAWKIDVENIKQELAGKDEIEVRQYLTSRSEIESAKIIFWPFWVKKIPSKESKIKITVE